eukprot:8519798-Pyramimonas_sp.AAC.1
MCIRDSCAQGWRDPARGFVHARRPGNRWSGTSTGGGCGHVRRPPGPSICPCPPPAGVPGRRLRR